jgi:hypothetical protein
MDFLVFNPNEFERKFDNWKNAIAHELLHFSSLFMFPPNK